MFGKLLKHELKATSRIIPIAFVVTVVLSLLQLLSSKYMGNVISSLFWGLSVIALVVQFVLVWVILIVQYYKTMHGSQAYLSHTLPVKGSTLFLSKYLISAMWIFLSIIIVFSMVSLLVSQSPMSDGFSSEIFETTVAQVGLHISFSQMILFGLGWFFLSSLGGLALYFFIITAGSTTRLGSLGIGGPVILFLIYNAAAQVINILATFILPIGFKVILPDSIHSTAGRIEFGVSNFWGNIISNSQTPFIPIGSFILEYAIYIVFFCITLHLVNKKMNLK